MYKTVYYFLTVVILAQSVVLPPELQEYVKDLHNICIQKEGVSESDHAAYDVIKNPHDPKLMCYMRCLMLEAKWMSPNGVIEYNFIEETAHPEIKDLLLSALNKCRSIEDSPDLCQKASNFNVCMYEADPVNWFQI